MKKKRSTYAKTTKRRTQIIQAALDCFNENGFTDATMEDIRRKSGASYGSVYHHFNSKEQLAAAVYLEGISDYQAGMIAMLEQKPKAKDGIFGMVSHHLEWVEANPEWARYLMRMRHADFMAEAEAAMADQNIRFSETLGGFFRENIQDGEFRILPGDIYISLILGPCMEFVRLWLEGKTASSLKQAGDEIAGAAWRALTT